MAASMARCQLCKNVKPAHFGPSRKYRKQANTAYYVLLPEVPPDTAENNPIMRTNENIDFPNLDAQMVIRGCAKLSIEFDVEMTKHGEKLKDPNLPKEFNTIFDPIEEKSVPLNYAQNTSRILNFVNYPTYSMAYKRVDQQIVQAWNERITLPLYNAVKELGQHKSSLTEYQQRMVDLYLYEGRNRGVELHGDQSDLFVAITKRLRNAMYTYGNKAYLSTNLFSHTIEDFSQVVDMPKGLIKHLAKDQSNPGKGPWMVTLQPDIFELFLEHCNHRLLRWNLWQANVNKCSISQHQLNLSNSSGLYEIVEQRNELAKFMGYENYAEMEMETKMAGSVENVINFIESLKTKMKPLADEETARLQAFAQSEGFNSSLELWDVPYWRRREREQMYQLHEVNLTEYYPYEKVLENMFTFFGDLLGIQIQDCSNSVPLWDTDVKYYEIKEPTDGSTIAGLYIDAYARPTQKLEGSWADQYRARSDVLGTFPISCLTMNLHPGLDGPTFMGIESAGQMFSQFGNCLQQLLTTVPYSEIGGQQNLEKDVSNVVSDLMEMLFYHPYVLKEISSHYVTGEKLPEMYMPRIIGATKHFSSYNIMHELYLSAFDLDMHHKTGDWPATMKKLWERFMPVPITEEDNHPCSLTPIFSEDYGCKYYSFLWSQMLAADLYEAFDEGFGDKEKMAHVGKRFRETFLALGGGVPGHEVFRRFRGRDPSQDALLRYYGAS